MVYEYVLKRVDTGVIVKRGIFGSIRDFFSDLWDRGKELIEDAVDAVLDDIREFVEDIKEALRVCWIFYFFFNVTLVF